MSNRLWNTYTLRSFIKMCGCQAWIQYRVYCDISNIIIWISYRDRDSWRISRTFFQEHSVGNVFSLFLPLHLRQINLVQSQQPDWSSSDMAIFRNRNFFVGADQAHGHNLAPPVAASCHFVARAIPLPTWPPPVEERFPRNCHGTAMASFEALSFCRGIFQSVELLANAVESVGRLIKWFRELKIACVGLEAAKRRLVFALG